MPRRGQRLGPYKKYLRNPEVAVPRTTVWKRRQQALGGNGQLNEENVEDARGIRQFDNNDSVSSASSNAGSDANVSMDYESEAAVIQTTDSDGSDPDSDYDHVCSEGSSTDSDSIFDSDEAPLGERDEYTDSDSDNDSVLNAVNINRGDVLFNLNGDQPNRQQLPVNLLQERREPLYPGAQITAEESEVLIKSFVVRWNLEDSAVEHLLRLLDCHMPVAMLGSQYCFLKKFPIGPSKKLRYFCPSCSRLLPVEVDNNFQCRCGYLCSMKALRNDGRMFVQMSIAEQIQQILCKEKCVGELRRECQESDVISGKVYKRFRKEGVIGDNDISLQWNTDGVQPCKTSRVTLYPIYACINELPYHVRRDNMMLCGLYYGKKKPDLHTFLKPFVEELNLLREVGIECNVPGRGEPVNVKVHTILCSVDSVARAPLQGIMAHNGRHGCSFCLRRGRRLDRGRGFARFYVGGHAGLPRSAAQHVQALEALERYNDTHRQLRKHVQGVTRRSILLSLAGFNIVKSFVPDYMHLVLEGVVKTFWSHWISSEYSNESWYLSKQKQRQISDKLLTIKPPVEVSRAPRAIDDLSYWRAHEFKSFLLYYSLVCLKGILPLKFLKHWLLLVFSMTVFLKDQIEKEEFLKATLALQRFVQDIATLYPRCYSLYTFNTHMLLHVPKAVENYGALWASSTFSYEHSNGILTRFIRGSQGIPLQICTSFLRLRHVNEFGFDVFSKNNSAEVGKVLLYSMLGKSHKTRGTYQCGQGLRYFGGPCNYSLSLIEKASLQELLQQDVDSNALCYRRFIMNGKVFHADSGGTLRVRDNSFAKLKDGGLVVISAILLVKISNSHEVVSACVCEQLQIIDEDLCRDLELAISSNDIMLTCHRSERIVSILPQSIDVKCIGVPYGNAVCLIPLANTIERD